MVYVFYAIPAVFTVWALFFTDPLPPNVPKIMIAAVFFMGCFTAPMFVGMGESFNEDKIKVIIYSVLGILSWSLISWKLGCPFILSGLCGWIANLDNKAMKR